MNIDNPTKSASFIYPIKTLQFMITQITNLAKIGNVDSTYSSQRYNLKMGDLLYTDGDTPTIIKPYSLVSFNKEHFSSEIMNGLGKIIQEEIHSKDINPRLGLGFSILSEGFLSINFWGGKYPSILNTSLYSFNSLPNLLKLLISPTSVITPSTLTFPCPADNSLITIFY